MFNLQTMQKQTFKTGDIIKNLWASERNPLRVCIYIQQPKRLLLGLNNDNTIYMCPVDNDFLKRMESDTEHFVKIGHCELEDTIKGLLNKYKI